MSELLLFSAPPEVQPALLLFGYDEPGEVQASLDVALPPPRLEAQLSTVSEAQLDASLPGPTLSALAVNASTFVRAALVVTLPAPTFAAQLVNAELLATAELEAFLPPPTFEAEGRASARAEVVVTLRAPTFEARAAWNSNVNRPIVCESRGAWQTARRISMLVEDRQQPPVKLRPGVEARWSAALPISASVEEADARPLRPVRVRREVRRVHTFVPARVQVLSSHAEMIRVRRRFQDSLQQATPQRAGWISDFRDRQRLRHAVGESVQVARPVRRATEHRHAGALPVRVLRVVRWQEAMVPPPGWGWQPPVTPNDPCYLPSGLLVFDAAAAANGDLLFICDRHGPGPQEPVIVPVRGVYMVTNSVSLVRVSDGAPVRCDSIAASLDSESWSWGATLALPASEFDLVAPTLTGPVELLATINGTPLHLRAEQVGRERVFGSSSLRVQCRGRIAELDGPYAAIKTFANSTARTAQQLMADVLTENGIPLDWIVEWGLDDWLVPAGIWSHQGTYISALSAIAKAAGGYLRPHANAASISVLHRYPVAPWDWADVTPDLVLPAAVARRESKTWETQPAYNRVFVAPLAQGLPGYQVTRDGTAGDLVAPLVVESLMTDVAAVRQRSRVELGRGGRQVTVGLGLPVLAETGIILPGTFVQYEDGADVVRGLVRSVSVESRLPTVWQSIGVETRV